MFTFALGACTTEKYFQVKTIPVAQRDAIFSSNGRCKIFFVGDSTSEFGENIDFSKYNKEQKLKMIEELLTFEGDKRICYSALMLYDPDVSSTYMGTCQEYTLDLEALFIINQIYLDQPFKYSPYPLLVNKEGIDHCAQPAIVDIAFRAYKRWFADLKKKGFDWKKYPLDESGVDWYF